MSRVLPYAPVVTFKYIARSKPRLESVERSGYKRLQASRDKAGRKSQCCRWRRIYPFAAFSRRLMEARQNLQIRCVQHRSNPVMALAQFSFEVPG